MWFSCAGSALFPDRSTVGAVQIVTHSYRDGAWSVLAVAGELDVVGGPDLRQQVMTEVREGHHHVVLDLTGVDFIDSFGLGVIVGALKRLRLLDGELRLVVPEPRLRRVFEVCDLDRVFDLHANVESALAVGV
jgi:anti-sigma B factor antagonist